MPCRAGRIAALVAAGGSNREVAEPLFVSHRTVEYHLHKIFMEHRATAGPPRAGMRSWRYAAACGDSDSGWNCSTRSRLVYMFQ
ncbi:helix-turn-helix transcriptional regulator [Streptomyces sp. NPDC014986]|uniref:helix-turn-helix domain-containing protein n=1 Tax=Streptomyces sp. NPDC014986 TaxID=3364934 RepID=UPI0036F67DB6